MRWLLALCILAPCVCQARPYVIEDMLQLESYGQVLLVPQVDRVLVERRRPYHSAGDYSYGYFVRRALSKVLTTGLRHPGTLEPLFEQADQAGYWLGGVSPNGRRVVVYRLQDRKLSMGIVDLARRTVKWLAVTPDLPLASPEPVWVDGSHVAIVTIPGGGLPSILSLGNAIQIDLQSLWRAAADGMVSSATATSSLDGAEDAPKRQLVEIDIEADTSRVLASGSLVDVSLSPDGRTFAVLAAGAYRHPPASTIDTSFVGRVHRLTLVDQRSGELRDIPGDILPGFMRWSADGNSLLAFGSKSDFERGHFIRVTREGLSSELAGSCDAVVDHRQSGTIVSAGWAGSSIVAAIRDHGVRSWRRIDRGCKPLPIPNGGELVGSTGAGLWFRNGGSLFVLDRRMRMRRVGSKVLTTGSIQLDPFATGYRHALHPEGPFPVAFSDSSVAIMPQRKRISGIINATEEIVAAVDGAVATVDEVSAGSTHLRLHQGGKSVTLDVLNRRLDSVDAVSGLNLRRRTSSGIVNDWLFLPLRTSMAPLVVIPYPGAAFGERTPLSGPGSETVPTNVRLLLSRGYAVLLPSLAASPSGARDGGLIEQIDQAVDSAITTKRVDRNRIGVLGHSYGAYAALSIATRSRRYRAVIASSGPYDLTGAHGMMAGSERLRLTRGLPFESSAGWVEGGQARMLSTPGASPARYVDASPLYHAADVQVPVMLVHGDMDTVAIDQAERMFMEIARVRGDARLVRYWGEGHVLASPANIRDYWVRVLAFFDEELGVTTAKPAPMPRSSPASPSRGSRG